MSQRPLSILHLMSVREYVGEAARVETLAREQTRRGHHVGILLRDGPCAQVMQTKSPFCAYLDTAPRKEGFWCGMRRVRALLRREHVDVLHAHRGKDHWRAVAARCGLGTLRPALVRTRHVVTPVHAHLPNRWLYGAGTDTVICASQAVRETMLASLPQLADHLPVIPGGFDLQEIPVRDPEVGRALRERLHIDPEAPVVLMPARIAPVKGQEYLINALPLVLNRCPTAVFVFAYPRSSDYRAFLDAHIQSLGVHQAIRWVTNAPSVWPLYDLATVCVVASIGSEGWSRVAVEAMLSGCPLVATQVGSLPEIVQDGKTGMLVPPRDPDALADALVSVLSSDARRSAMAQAARELSLGYTATRMTDAVLEIYRELTEKVDEFRAS